MNDLVHLDATALAELVHKRAVQPLELVDATIARIEALNPKLNTVVTPMFEAARHAARGSLPDGPFRGVPYLLKDILGTQGPAPGDPYYATPPARPYVDEVKTAPGRLRVVLSTRSPTGSEVHADCVRAACDAAKLCEELGHHVEERDPPIAGDLLTQAFMVLWTAGAAVTLDGMAMASGNAATPENVEPLSYALAEAGRARSAPEYLIATTLLQRLTREIARFMEDYTS
jgi:Asp-tRNA(Asn)/Glu-tRNA(Gln) amidotransferase A subunit family amidase